MYSPVPHGHRWTSFDCIGLLQNTMIYFSFCLILSCPLLGQRVDFCNMSSSECLEATHFQYSGVTPVMLGGPCAGVQTQTSCTQNLHSPWWPVSVVLSCPSVKTFQWNFWCPGGNTFLLIRLRCRISFLNLGLIIFTREYFYKSKLYW